MGRARRQNRRRNQRDTQRGTQRDTLQNTQIEQYTGAQNGARGKPIDDCFSLYILFRKLHNLFVEQAYSILYNTTFENNNNNNNR